MTRRLLPFFFALFLITATSLACNCMYSSTSGDPICDSQNFAEQHPEVVPAVTPALQPVPVR